MHPVTSTAIGDVAVIDFDDGKANALSHDVVDGLRDALGTAVAGPAGAIAIVGRAGRFSAGFDLNVMRTDGAIELMNKGADLALELFTCPKPVVFGVTGHALAMGAVLLCTPDYRVGATGDFKIGLNEVRISMPVPPFATELARDRLVPGGVHPGGRPGDDLRPGRGGHRRMARRGGRARSGSRPGRSRWPPTWLATSTGGPSPQRARSPRGALAETLAATLR